MQQTKSRTRNKFLIGLGTLFFALLGGLIPALLLGLLILFSTFIIYPLAAVLVPLYFPLIVTGALGGSYFFLRGEPIPKGWLIKTYKRIIIILLLVWVILFAIDLKLSNEVRIQYAAFEEALSKSNYTAAYQFMTEDYRADHDLKSFIDDALLFNNSVQEPLSLWAIDVNIFSLKASVDPYQSSFFDYGYITFDWEKVDGNWYFSGEYIWYE